MAVARIYRQTFMKQEIIKKLIHLMNDYVMKHTKGEFSVRIYEIEYHNNEKMIEKRLYNVLEPKDNKLKESSPHYRKLLELLDGWLHTVYMNKNPITVVAQEDFDFLNELHRILLYEIRSGKY